MGISPWGPGIRRSATCAMAGASAIQNGVKSRACAWRACAGVISQSFGWPVAWRATSSRISTIWGCSAAIAFASISPLILRGAAPLLADVRRVERPEEGADVAQRVAHAVLVLD